MQEYSPLLIDLYELTMAEVYFKHKQDTAASFDLFVRNLPSSRSYFLACGLEDVLTFIKRLEFNQQSIDYLKKLNLFSKKFLSYLRGFKFRGDIWAMPEGEVFFANEPILRVTANIIEAQILESFLLNTINLQSMIATKASRVVHAAGKRPVYDFSLRRTHGKDAGIKVARSAYLAGFAGTSNVLAGMRYGIPVVGTMAHSYVMSFKSELESFDLYSRTFPKQTTLLVDTYNTKTGIENAINIGKRLKKRGHRLLGIRLDSADLVSLSRFARRQLNAKGLKEVKILASGNLDEYRIDRLIRQGSMIDNFGVGTHMGTSSDSPYLDVIYKLSQISYEAGKFLPTMKLSRGKVTYPGRKQVFRIKNKAGFFIKDILALEDERVKGEPLLIKVVEAGEIIYRIPPLKKIREFTRENLTRLPQIYKAISAKNKYPVTISKGLRKLTSVLSRDLKRRK